MDCQYHMKFKPYYKLRMNVFSNSMFHQFVSFAGNDNETESLHNYTSKNWIFSGGIIGVFAPPLVVFGVFINGFLIFILVQSIKKQFEERIFGIIFAIVYLIELTYNLFLLDFMGTGKVWLNNEGIFLDQYGPLACKFVHYVRQTLTSFEVNLILLESYFCHISVMAFGRFTYSSILAVFTIISALGISLIMAAPTFIVNNLWRLDFRYYCGPDPAWSSPVIHYYCFHRAIFVEGIFQSILVIIFNILTFVELKSYRSLNYILEKTRLDTHINLDLIIEINNYVQEYCDKTSIILCHTTISALFCIPRTIFYFNLFKEIYFDFEDNTNIKGVMEFYTISGFYNLQYLFYYLFISCHFWIYFFNMKSFRYSVKKVFMDLSRNNPNISNFINLFLLGDSTTEERFINDKDNLLDNLDSITVDRLKLFERKIMNH